MPYSFSDSSDEDEIAFPDLKELLYSLPSKRIPSQTRSAFSEFSDASVVSKSKRSSQYIEWTVYDSEDDSFMAPISISRSGSVRKSSKSPSSLAKDDLDIPCLQARRESLTKVDPPDSPVGSQKFSGTASSRSGDIFENTSVGNRSNGLLDAEDECDIGISLQTSQFKSTPPSTPCTNTSTFCRQRNASPTDVSSSVYYSCASDIEVQQSFNSDTEDIYRPIPVSKTRPRVRRRIICESDSELDSTSSSEAALEEAILTYSPPRRARPQVAKLLETPLIPATPSARTSKHRIPRSPHRESNVKFWDEEESTAWVELHKPRATPARTPLGVDLSSYVLNSSDFRSPRTLKSPKRRVEEHNHPKETKQFVVTREETARAFVDEFLAKVCPELSPMLSAPIEIFWSKTLASTAGRANYLKSKNMAKIELSTKVIDCLARLRSTLAHEMCHIMVWVIDGQFANPHGKEFKTFGRRVERILGIEVDTTHNYKINYKYQWQCTKPECVKIYGRHSKSLDPTKVVCGTCHSKLVQILPKPRVNATPRKVLMGTAQDSPAKADGLGRYQTFLKANIDRIRSSNPGLKYAELIKIVAAEYAIDKAKQLAPTTTILPQKDSIDELEGLVSKIEL